MKMHNHHSNNNTSHSKINYLTQAARFRILLEYYLICEVGFI